MKLPPKSKAWKTDAQYWSWLRGQLRRIWAKYPVRNDFKSNNLRLITQEERNSGKYHPSTKKLGLCNICKEWFPASKLEVDHIVGGAKCSSKEEAESFLWHCVGLSGDDLQLLCKATCHPQKSYSEKMGISFEEAKIEKQMVAFRKLKAEQQRLFLLTKGLTVGANKVQNESTYREFLKRHS